jgi:hypothetical protein
MVFCSLKETNESHMQVDLKAHVMNKPTIKINWQHTFESLNSCLLVLIEFVSLLVCMRALIVSKGWPTIKPAVPTKSEILQASEKIGQFPRGIFQTLPPTNPAINSSISRRAKDQNKNRGIYLFNLSS